jgi:outer membrane protein OmpA-like peptidoglycan-associated protein
MENILEIMSTTMLGGETLSKLSAQMRESPGATRRGLETAVPASVAALAAHTSSEQKAEELLGAFRGGDYPHVELAEIAQVVSDPEATSRLTKSSAGFLGRIFGSGLDSTLDSIAGRSGLSRASASTVLGLAAPLVLNAVSTVARSRNFDAAGLSRFLSSQLPGASAGVAGADATLLRESASHTLHRVSTETDHGSSELQSSHRGLWTALLAAALVLLALMIFGRRNRPDARIPGTEDLPAEREAPSAAREGAEPAIAPRAEPEPARVATVLSAGTGASALSQYLEGTAPLPRTFVLENVQFPKASSMLPNTPLLNDTAAALREHPQARVRLEGSADATGTVDANARLSQARAKAVKSYLISHGIQADRIDTAGLAAEHALASNTSAQARAENRRMELIVVAR